MININGFKETGHRLRNVNFFNVLMPENSKIAINDAENVKFAGVKSTTGLKPQYTVTGSSAIVY